MQFNFNPSNDSNIDPLKEYARNLNDDVARGKVDKVIGRDSEIRRIIEIISRKTKNNPVLIGEPGVGKTAIVEGLASRIVSGDVPESLKDKEIYELSLSSLIAGASFQGQFEERIQKILKKVKDSEGKIILFIDEIHQLVGMGRNSSSGAMDAANILKPMMARGEIKIIGATTLNEYREHIEKDSALERRMQKVFVSEPNKQEALTILRGLKEKWELFHKVKINDSALVAAVNLSDRYITDRFLPDKAIDLVDEACAKIKTEMNSVPEELDNVIRQITHLETEKFSLLDDEDKKSEQKAQDVEKQIDELKKRKEQISLKWNQEKKSIKEIIDIKEEIEKIKEEVQILQEKGEYEKASKKLYSDLPKKEELLNKKEKTLSNNELALLKDSVNDEIIAEILSKTTGIPIRKLLQEEKHKILELKTDLKYYVKGQDEAIDKVTSVIYRSKAGINDPKRPIGSFLFLGPTGVGKTELAKSLAKILFDSEKSMFRVDMSEFSDKHSISKLIGSPPGYVGYEKAGSLTEFVRRRPYSILLFDEIEKAHPDVLNILLQVLDDGILTDSHSRTVNFKNTIIIMTSNIGSLELLQDRKEDALETLKKILKPEFINRIDEIIRFSKLQKTSIMLILDKLISELNQRLKDSEYNISLSDEAKAKIISDSYSDEYGARPIKRYLQSNIENVIAEAILSSTITKNKKYVINLKDNSFVISKKTLS